MTGCWARGGVGLGGYRYAADIRRRLLAGTMAGSSKGVGLGERGGGGMSG